jgi:hypothetical protein
MRILLITALACTLVGCGGNTRFKVVPVKGKITFSDGSFLPVGTILVFNPAEGKVGTASGSTDDQGSFTLFHVGGQAGAEVCKYFIQLLPPKGSSPAEFEKAVPKSAASGELLFAEVREGMGELELRVPRP